MNTPPHRKDEMQLFPPFNLGENRVLYLEATNSMVKARVELDTAYQKTEQEEHACAVYHAHEEEIKRSILRIIALSDPYLADQLIRRLDLPNTFVIRGKGYTLLAHKMQWNTPNKFDILHTVTGNTGNGSQPSREKVNSAGIKWRFTFAAEGLMGVESEGGDEMEGDGRVMD